MVFGLAQHHKYQISEVESLLPFERDLYYEMLIDFIETQQAEENK
jgi:hypothetical protein